MIFRIVYDLLVVALIVIVYIVLDREHRIPPGGEA